MSAPATGTATVDDAAGGIAFISWADDCSRSDSIAARLGGRSHMVYSPEWGSRPATILFKYLSQARKTWQILRRDRPRTVFVMTPPPFAALPVWIYCRLTGSRFFIDAHSAAFYHPRWRHILFIKRFFCRRARATLVTNAVLEDVVRSWGAPVMVVPDVPIRFREPEAYPLPAAPAITLVCTFADDEPVQLLFDAARELPEIPFFVTGDPAQADAALLARRPPNVTLTGFIPRAQYVGLLTGSAAIMTLTTDDNTMQRGAYEAIYLGKPVITVNHSFLQREFPAGTVHVPLSAAGIRDGIREFFRHRDRLEDEARALRATKLERWERVSAELRRLMA